jgi:hypothetical protein
MPKGSVTDSSSDSRGRGLMRRHSAGVRATVVGAVALASLVLVAAAGAVTITNFSPHSGLPAKDNGEACPGGTIQFNGNGFVSDGAIGGGAVQVGVPTQTVKVFFGGVPSTYVLVGSNTVMYAVVPDGAVDGPITIQTGAGSFSTANETDQSLGTNFYVNPCPQISLKVAQANAAAAQGADTSSPSIYKMKPASGKAGTAVTLTGTNFLSVTGVLFGQVKAKFTIVSPTQITTTVPKGAKTGRVVLQYPIGASKSQAGNGLAGSAALTPSNVPSNSGAKAAYQYSKTNFVVK